jgi:hypothetical protein
VTLRGAISRAVGRTPTAPGADQVRPKIPSKHLIFQLLRPPFKWVARPAPRIGRRIAFSPRTRSSPLIAECPTQRVDPMPRTKGEKKRARAMAIGRQRKLQLEGSVAEQAAELAAVRAQNAELSSRLSASQFDCFNKATRIAELEARLSLQQQQQQSPPQPSIPGAVGQEQRFESSAGCIVPCRPHPHPLTTPPVQLGTQQFCQPLQPPAAQPRLTQQQLQNHTSDQEFLDALFSGRLP